MQFYGNTFINKHIFLLLTIVSSVVCYNDEGKKRSGKTPSSLPPILLLELFTSQILVLNNNGTNNSLMLKDTEACSVNIIVPHYFSQKRQYHTEDSTLFLFGSKY